LASLLSGIRVLDFGRYIAGPYCAAILAEYGADVIRIEKRSGGEDRFIAPITEGGEGGMFLQMNRNKRSLTLDPMSAEGREIVKRLVANADVVVANLPEPALKSMGLDYPSLSAINPKIILVTSSAFGAEGPMAKNVGFDGVAQAMSGAIYMTGEPEQPYRAAVNWVDFGTALHCAMGTLAALMARSQSGRGQIVSGSLLSTAVSFANAAMIEQAIVAPNRVPTGNRGQTAAPVDIFKTQDGWILIQVVGQPLYERWAKLMHLDRANRSGGTAVANTVTNVVSNAVSDAATSKDSQTAELDAIDWLHDPRFENDELRGLNGKLVSLRAAAWCASRSSEQAVKELGDAKIPCGPVLSPQQALDHPQLHAAGLFHPTAYPGMAGLAPIARAAVTLSDTPKVAIQRAPVLGEHTEAILQELGYGRSEIDALRQNSN
jgi:crotonobetainyl-CoA:carnitine CoA-transferase CaiB-like acyl-CoA transferase